MGTALATLPMAGILVCPPAVSSACLPGETGVTTLAHRSVCPEGARRPDRVVRCGARPVTECRHRADRRLGRASLAPHAPAPSWFEPVSDL